MSDDNLTVDSFYDQGTKGRLVGLQCKSKHITVPPRHSCSVCGSKDLHKIDLSGMGEVTSFTEVFVKSGEFPVDVPYVLAIVTLEEGGKLIGVVRAGNSNLDHGVKVMVEFRKLNEKEWPRIFFRLV